MIIPIAGAAVALQSISAMPIWQFIGGVALGIAIPVVYFYFMIRSYNRRVG